MAHRTQAGLPLHLCQVLEEEAAGLWGTETAAGTWEFTREELDEGALLARLRALPSGFTEADPVALALRGLLAPEFLVRLDDESEPDEAALSAALVDQLNRLLDRPDLAGSLGIDEADEPPELRALAAAAGDLGTLRRVNRLVLEAALPEETRSVYERRLAAAYARMPAGSALCLSGGGVRSAVFSLGVVQALARHGLLPRFDYLSTVSGGGYLGGMLTAWIHRHDRGIQGVTEELVRTRRPSALKPEARPLAYLRTFSNYLSPRPGLLSADTWSLIAVYLRNLVLHWLILVPLLVGVVLIPWFYLTFLRWAPTEPDRLAPWLPRWSLLAALPNHVAPANLSVFLLGSGLMSGAIAYIGLKRPSGRHAIPRRRAGRRRDWGRGPVAGSRRLVERLRRVFGADSQSGFLLFCLLPLVASAAALTVFWAWHRGVETLPQQAGSDPGWSWFLVPSMAINVLGWSVHAIPWFRRERRVLPKIWELPAALVAGCFGGALTRVVALSVFPHPVAEAPEYVAFALPALLGIFLAGETLFAGLVSRWSDDEDREWWSRSGGWILIAACTWIAVAMAVIAGPPLLLELPQILAPLGGASAIATALLARSSGSSEVRSEGERRSPLARAMDWGLALVAPLFVVMLVAALALAVGTVIGFVGDRLAPGLPLPAAQADLKARLHWSAPALDRVGQDCAEVPPIPICLGRESLDYVARLFGTGVRPPLLTLIAALGLALALGFFMNINRFSLHATYRNRLIRTFLGATRERRRPNRFTGFDPGDNFAVHRLRNQLFLQADALGEAAPALCRRLRDDWSEGVRAIHDRLSARTRSELRGLRDGELPGPGLVDRLVADCNRFLRIPFDERLRTQVGAPKRSMDDGEEGIAARRRALLDALLPGHSFALPRPFHVVNLALNLVQGDNLAWQQRKAEPFTVSPLHCGSARIGYRPASEYGIDRDSALSFGTAMAVSGAAASPNMGYHSSPAITFLMTFFNVRLGWWLGNPGPGGARGRAWRRANPRFAVGPLIAETLGLTNDRRRYVYLSDGGHFENLGLYEMVLRRCRWIVVVDAGQDPDCRFEDLGNAVRKARVDLGVDVRFERMPIRGGKAEKGGDGRYCALGTICYPDGSRGRLLYFKPVVYGDEPRDVVHYHARNPQFPHESTGDQWFSESQFESYRRLGAHAVDSVVGVLREGERLESLADLFDRAGAYVGGAEAGPDSKPEPERKPPRARARRAASSSA